MNRPHLPVIVEVTSQKKAGGHERSNHQPFVRQHASPHDHAMGDEEENCTQSIQGSIDGRKNRVLGRHSQLGWRDETHAAGFVVRRLTITKATPNITSVNTNNTTIDEATGSDVCAAGKSNPRSASTP